MEWWMVLVIGVCGFVGGVVGARLGRRVWGKRRRWWMEK